MAHQLNQDLFGLKNRWLQEHGYTSGNNFIITNAFEKWWQEQGFSQAELFLTREYTNYEKKIMNYYYNNLVRSDGDIKQTRKRLNNFIVENYSDKEAELLRRMFDNNNVLNQLDNYYQHQNPSVKVEPYSHSQNTDKPNNTHSVHNEDNLWQDKYNNIFNKDNKQVIQVLKEKYDYHIDSIKYSTINAALEMDKGIPKYVMMDLALGGSKGQAVHLYQIDNSLLIHAHGNPNGTLKYHGEELKISDLVDFLESNNKIDDNIADIFTISCFGGNQEEFTSKQGRKVRSSHNSNKPIVGAPKTQLGESNDLLLFSIDEQGNFTEEFLKLIQKHNQEIKYLNIGIKDNETIDNNLLEGLEEYLQNKAEQSNKEIINQTNISEQKPEFVNINEYEPYTDEFYQSRGKDPVVERQKVKDFYESRNLELPEELKKYFNDNEVINKSLENITKESTTQEINEPEVKDSSVEHVADSTISKPEENKQAKEPKVESKDINKKEQITDLTVKQTSENTTDSTSSLSKKSLDGNGKIAIGIIAASLIISSVISSDKEPKKQTKDNKRQDGYQQYGMTYSQQQIDNSYAMQMAQDISSYRYGKHMTGFVNF